MLKKITFFLIIYLASSVGINKCQNNILDQDLDGKFQNHPTLESAKRILSKPGYLAILADPVASKIVELQAMLGTDFEKAAKSYNLCNIHVPGTNLFCHENKHIPRFQMPQLIGRPRAESLASKLPRDKSGKVDATQPFVDYLLGRSAIENLQKKAYKISCPMQIEAQKLKATQEDIIGSKVARMWWKLNQNSNWVIEQKDQCDLKNCNKDIVPRGNLSGTKGITAPIFVSEDNYILDGHHRWATIITSSRFLPNLKICVRKVNSKIENLLKEAHNFTKKFGIMNEVGTIKK